MSTTVERAPVPDLFRHLPAIYRPAAYPQRSDPTGYEGENPFTVLVGLLAKNQGALEARLASVPAMLDPRTAPCGFDHPRQGFLELLAEWVALDPAVLGRGTPIAGEAGGPDPRSRVLRHLVENAAPLQAARGTLAGTRYLLEVLFDADVQILEWTWPAAYQIGEATTLGVDTLLVGEPPLDRCITLVRDSRHLRQAIQWARSQPQSYQVVELVAGEDIIGGIIGLSGNARADDPAAVATAGAFMVDLPRLQEVLWQELPAHVASYIGFRLPGPSTVQGLQPFIVGIETNATLGQIQIQREP